MADESPKNVDGKLLQLPLSRIKMIMKSSPDVGNVSQEGYFLIARSAVSAGSSDDVVSILGLKSKTTVLLLIYIIIINFLNSNNLFIYFQELFAQYLSEQGFKCGHDSTEVNYKGLGQ